MRVLLALCLISCGDNQQPKPDAGIDAVMVAPPDAAVDAPPDAGCWRTVDYHCTQDGTVIQLCVPYSGCATFTCGGQQMSYCGPGPR